MVYTGQALFVACTLAKHGTCTKALPAANTDHTSLHLLLPCFSIYERSSNMAGNKHTQQPGFMNDNHSSFQTWLCFFVKLQTSAHRLKSQQILAKDQAA